ncbi:protein phosphatase 1 regulatory subunit sds22 [Zygosaccharomyces mellis]|uniref:Protein phosphatase 1 regulatory subunit sds22 n=1 Tax=Zygosaccharomyces mellis TaxID=42258 RepID=A0A4C2E410_9SACH|nr:protein phosphatase 1 regulatory subunit sds22 [Zygosaccharomyces mellis]
MSNNNNNNQVIDQQDIPNPSLPTEVIPDTHEEYICADSELTDDLPDETEVIDLVHLKIEAMEDLKLYRFKRLVQLCLRQNLIESISEVDSLPVETIKDLDFYDNRIKHISKNINKLVNLENLDLSFNKIKHIKNLDNLVNLQNLYFVQNRISTIENLSTLKNLKNLELGGNEIREIAPDSFKGLENLQEIWLGKNSIPKLVNLHHLKNLRVLSIQSNRLRKIEGLEELENLEELYLSHNYLTKIEGLEHNKKLTIIDITSNKITKVENMKHLVHLTDFWASFNKIDQSFESIGEELGKLPRLDTLYLEGNPIQSKNETSYRRKLVMNLGPSLQKIDATYIRG